MDPKHAGCCWRKALCQSAAALGVQRDVLLMMMQPWRAAPALQDPESPDTSAIEKLFGIRLHSNLECKESGEKIQVGDGVGRTADQLCCGRSYQAAGCSRLGLHNSPPVAQCLHANLFRALCRPP